MDTINTVLYCTVHHAFEHIHSAIFCMSSLQVLGKSGETGEVSKSINSQRGIQHVKFVYTSKFATLKINLFLRIYHTSHLCVMDPKTYTIDV